VAPHEPVIRADLHKAGVTDQQIEYVREGMRRVVADGTGKRAQIKGVQVAGKTGTAQFWRGTKKDNHTWFITFAPYEEPRYAMCIMVQGAKSGGGVSSPIAQKIMEECLALEKGYDPGLQPMTPAIGSFRPIEMVDFKASAVPSAISGQLDDQETADHADAPIKVETAPDRARPDIRAAADARGRVPKGQRPPPPPVEKRNFFQKFFGIKPAPPRAVPVPPRGR
jgi:penicillin-binding protein 2